MRGFVAGFVLASFTLLSIAERLQQDAVELEPGDEVPFAGVLVTMEDFDAMLQAKLDVPLLREEIAAWERGHELAIQAMESAQEALKGCQPKRGTLDKVLSSMTAVAPLALAWSICSGNQ